MLIQGRPSVTNQPVSKPASHSDQHHSRLSTPDIVTGADSNITLVRGVDPLVRFTFVETKSAKKKGNQIEIDLKKDTNVSSHSYSAQFTLGDKENS